MDHGIDLPSFLLSFASALLGAKLLGEAAGRRSPEPFRSGESIRACPRAGSDVDRFPRQVRGRLLRLGGVRPAFIGAGMIPRGEVGLIFASLGKATGALPEGVFVAVVLAVFATTFLAPPLLKAFRQSVGSGNGRPRDLVTAI